MDTRNLVNSVNKNDDNVSDFSTGLQCTNDDWSE